MDTTCYFCPATNAPVNGAHWTGTEYARVNACTEHSGSFERAPRRPVVRQPIAFDGGGLIALHGIERKSRRRAAVAR
jgi:hypothetical protein